MYPANLVKGELMAGAAHKTCTPVKPYSKQQDPNDNKATTNQGLAKPEIREVTERAHLPTWYILGPWSKGAIKYLPSTRNPKP